MERSIRLFLLLSISLFTVYCADDDLSDTANPELIGTWKAISYDAVYEATTGPTVTSTISSDNLDYSITFSEESYSTNGSYDITVITNANGILLAPENTSYSDINVSGTYSEESSNLRIIGDLYEYEVDAVDLNGLGIEQEMTYEINENEELTITQDEVITNGGISTRAMSTSIWKKQ